MHINIDHITKYSFSFPTKMVIQTLRLTPQSSSIQNVLSWDINVDCDAHLNPFYDAYGNLCHILSIEAPVQEFSIEVIGSVDTYTTSGVVADEDANFPLAVYKRFTSLASFSPELKEFTFDNATDKNDLGKTHQLLGAIYKIMRFDTSVTDAQTDAVQAFAAKSGVCQDYAHIFIACSRLLGLPSRYVSGHLLRQDGANLQEASHAWAETYVDGLGWIAFDPANGICADEHYVKVAVGLDYRDAAPIAGARYGGGQETLSVGLNVRKAGLQFQSQSQ